MRLITFLGTGRYEETSYVWHGKEHRARFAPCAASEFLRPESITVLLTRQAQDAHWRAFQEELRPSLAVERREIPSGREPGELWAIFDAITSGALPDESIALDITHGLRTFPLLALLAGAFLRAGLGVRLEAVLYGAYDVRDLKSDPPRTPFFDLTPMIDLIDWANAAARFERTGDARDLAHHLRAHRKLLATEHSPELAGALGNVAGWLQDLSSSLRLIRPAQAFEAAARLPGQSDRARPAIKARPELMPFGLVLDRLQGAYADLALTAPQDPRHAATCLATQRRLLDWYLNREQYVQAVTLAREWLVSLALLALGRQDLFELESRERIAGALSAESRDMRRALEAGRSFQPLLLAGIPEIERLIDLWGRVIELRNDLSHAGMRPDPKPAQTIIDTAGALVAELRTLSLPGDPAS